MWLALGQSCSGYPHVCGSVSAQEAKKQTLSCPTVMASEAGAWGRSGGDLLQSVTLPVL